MNTPPCGLRISTGSSKMEFSSDTTLFRKVGFTMMLASIDFGKIASAAVMKHSAKVLAGAAATGLESRHIPNLLNDVTHNIVGAALSEDDFEECFMDLTDEIGVPATVAVFSEFIEDAILAEWESKALAG